MGIETGESRAVHETDHAGGVDDVVHPRVRHGAVDSRLQALLVEHDAGAGQAGALTHGQLEVVGLDARRCQRAHLEVVARDPLGDELQRVERRHHVTGATGATAPSERRDQEQ